MDRIGLVRPGEIKDNCENADGSIRVNNEKCYSCPYRPESDFAPQLKRIHRLSKDTKELNICHNTFPSDVQYSICKGSYDAFSSYVEKEIQFVSLPKSRYIVRAVNEGAT